MDVNVKVSFVANIWVRVRVTFCLWLVEFQSASILVSATHQPLYFLQLDHSHFEMAS